jgi:hypothetical protein
VLTVFGDGHVGGGRGTRNGCNINVAEMRTIAIVNVSTSRWYALKSFPLEIRRTTTDVTIDIPAVRTCIVTRGVYCDDGNNCDDIVGGALGMMPEEPSS